MRFLIMTPKYIDIHSHVNFKAFDSDRDEVIKRALENNTWVINVGTQLDTSRKAVEIANQYPEGVYAIIGLHPIHTGASYHDEKELGEGGKEFTSRGEIFNRDLYKNLAQDKKVVAIGECGLDYYRLDTDSAEKQKKVFIEHIELANEVGKPLMLHIRNAYKDAYEILKKHLKSKSLPAGRQGNVHFFAGTWEEAKSFLDLGFTLSFTGVITFPPKAGQPGADTLIEIIKNTPLDMIMSETDSPYVTPIPHRGKRNEPSYVKEVVKKIAEVKNLPEEEVALAIIANAKRVFTL